jgi:hypothetical protein
VNGRIVTCLILTALFAAFVGQAFFFRHEAAVMPLLIGLPGVILCLAQLTIELRRAGKASDEPIFSTTEGMIVLWLSGFVLGVIALGFVVGTPLLVAAYLFFVAHERRLVAVLGAGLCLAAMYGLERALNIPLFEGLVVHYLL